MRESTPGGFDRVRENDLPRGARLYKQTSSYKVYISDSKQEIIIDTADYHPGMLHITKGDLEKILEKLRE